MNKNIAVVGEVAAWAKKLNRIFVEPTYCYSRVAPPFDSIEAGACYGFLCFRFIVRLFYFLTSIPC